SNAMKKYEEVYRKDFRLGRIGGSGLWFLVFGLCQGLFTCRQSPFKSQDRSPKTQNQRPLSHLFMASVNPSPTVSMLSATRSSPCSFSLSLRIASVSASVALRASTAGVPR